MRLSEFIRANEKAIIMEWEDYARSFPPAPGMTRDELRNNITGLLEFFADNLEECPTRDERQAKAKGMGCKKAPGQAAVTHAEQRFRKGFDTLEMISEFRVLRASIMKIWACPKTDEGILDLIRFNEAVDEAMTESLQKYMENEKRARSLFLGTLVHDLRNPINAIAQAAQILIMNKSSAEESKLAGMIQTSARRISQLVSELIDAVRVRLGKGIPIAPVVSNLGDIALEVLDEIRLTHPGARINIDTSGDLVGEWDNVRMGQVVSNLIGNAVQHGGHNAAIDVRLAGEQGAVRITVHNMGSVIPPKLVPVIFDPLTRGVPHAKEQPRSTSLGLGLFITHEIVRAHDGDISVTSSKEEGTTFTVTIPRVFSGRAVAGEETGDRGIAGGPN
jgi:signal transduction histidine kinase